MVAGCSIALALRSWDVVVAVTLGSIVLATAKGVWSVSRSQPISRDNVRLSQDEGASGELTVRQSSICEVLATPASTWQDRVVAPQSPHELRPLSLTP